MFAARKNDKVENQNIEYFTDDNLSTLAFTYLQTTCLLWISKNSFLNISSLGEIYRGFKIHKLKIV